MASAPSKNELAFEEFDFVSKRELGTGGFGTVYAVMYKQKEVAVKRPHFLDDIIDKEVRRGNRAT